MTVPAIRPLDPGDPDVRKLALIELAQQRGMPWTAICAALGARDKNHAKKIKAELERRVKAGQYGLGREDPACSTGTSPTCADTNGPETA